MSDDIHDGITDALVHGMGVFRHTPAGAIRVPLGDFLAAPKPSLEQIEREIRLLLTQDSSIPENIALEFGEIPGGVVYVDMADIDTEYYVATAFCPADTLDAAILAAGLRLSYWLYLGRIQIRNAGE